MCIRIQTCCGASLRNSSLFVAYYTAVVTVVLYFLSGYFLFLWLTHPARGAYEAADNDSMIGAYGSLYLAFAGLWTMAVAALLVAIYAVNLDVQLTGVSARADFFKPVDLCVLEMGLANILGHTILNLEEAPFLALPWLVLQVLSLGLAVVNVISEAAITNYMAFVGTPFIFVGLIMYIIVYSHFMDLHEARSEWRHSTTSFPSISRGVV